MRQHTEKIACRYGYPLRARNLAFRCYWSAFGWPRQARNAVRRTKLVASIHNDSVLSRECQANSTTRGASRSGRNGSRSESSLPP
jgi:hypothetical protein